MAARTVNGGKGALADVLAAGRTRFNAQVAEARHRYPGFDTAAFAGFLRDTLAPLAEAVAPERIGAVVLAGFALGLQLVGQGLAGPGARDGIVDRAWRAGAAPLAPLIGSAPQETLGVLSHALLQLGRWPGVRRETWLQRLLELAPQVENIAVLRALGQVLAWRAGMAHYRDGALRAAEGLPPALASAALGDPAMPAATLLERYRADPWWRADGPVYEGLEAGGFSGFGGSFAVPPEVRAGARDFVVRSGERCHALLADVHGAVLIGAETAEFEAAPAGASALPPRAQHALDAAGAKLGLPTEGLRFALSAHTLAVSSPYSHLIRLLPLR